MRQDCNVNPKGRKRRSYPKDRAKRVYVIYDTRSAGQRAMGSRVRQLTFLNNDLDLERLHTRCGARESQHPWPSPP